MHWLTRSLIALLSIVLYTLSFAQPILTWTSPVGTDSSLSGWITLRDNPVETKFYRMTSTSIQIMNGPTSTTVSFTIPIVAEEWDYFQLYPTLYTTGDITGDGRNEIVVTSMVGTSSPYRYGFRFVNSTSGANVIIFNNSSYSYYLYYVDDMDNNNLNELIVMRYNYLLTTNEYNYLYYTTSGMTAVGEQVSVAVPASADLLTNYPNPFNSHTKMRFTLPQPGNVKLSITDNTGRVVRNFELPSMSAGKHEVLWDGKNQSGQPVSSGSYFGNMQANGTTATEPMILLK